MRVRMLVAAFFALAWAGTVSAGGEKCEYSTQECLDYMATKMKGSGWVGVELDRAEDTEAMRVTRIVANSPAEGAGIQAGDLLVAINGIALGKANEEKLMDTCWSTLKSRWRRASRRTKQKGGSATKEGVPRNGAPFS
jgi:C-terminal processing protease CtpA/Prc